MTLTLALSKQAKQLLKGDCSDTKLDLVPSHLDLVPGHVVPIHMPSNNNCHSLALNITLRIYDLVPVDLVPVDLGLEYMVKGMLVQNYSIDTIHLVPDVIGTKCNWYQMQLVLNAIGTKCNWYQMQLVPNAIGTKCNWHQMQLVPNELVPDQNNNYLNNFHVIHFTL